MKRPRPNPKARQVPPRLAAAPARRDLDRYEKFARYVGSAEHKAAPWHDIVPSHRRDASHCPTHITLHQATRMLKAGIRAGNISEDFEGEMPKRVWYAGSLGNFAARLTDRADMASGKPAGYKAWPETPENLPCKPRPVRQSNEV